MPFQSFRSLISACVLSLPLLAAAGPYSSMVVFGDSLSDTGNLQIVSGGAFPDPGQPYFGGRFSNGLLWVENLAASLGVAGDAAPFLAGGKNYAFAGARSGVDLSPPGVLAQVAGIWGPSNAFADPSALYVVVGGGNDMRDARTAFPTNSLADQAGRFQAAADAVANLGNAVGYLASIGAKHVLISNLPDLGNTPEAAMLGLQAASSDATSDFNALVGGLLALEGFFPGLDIDLLDMAGVAAMVYSNPAAFGVTNPNMPCGGFFGSIGGDCASSLFSDALHPSAFAHNLIANAAFDALDVPEPDSLALFGLAFMGLAVVRRRQVLQSA